MTANPRANPDIPDSVNDCCQWLRSQPGIDNDEVNQGLQAVAILQTLGMDDQGCVAALLHCAVPIEFLDAAKLTKQFEPPIISLYQGVYQLQKLSSFSRLGDGHVDSETNEDNLRKMLITMVDDVRVVLIKLADQLRLLRGARDKSREYQNHLSQLTLDLFAPLANRLGIWQLKWEMEDFALRYSDPEVYRQLAAQLDEKREAREQYIQSLIDALRSSLNDMGISSEIYGRPKHIYSIWKKMRQKGLSFENLWDIRAVRIVVESVAECYSVLGVVHTLWRHLPGEFDDYIATPKANGYRSIHTVVIGPEDKSVEVQIRTREMHEENELGIAAHWRYKERRHEEESIDSKVLWLRQLLEWKQELSDTDSLAEAFRERVENRRVYVFTPKGTVIDLPEGATPIDFAYAIHTEVGHSTRGARVNGKMVPLGYHLKTGDQVQIQTVKSAAPSRDWLRPDLEYIRTQRARTRIQQWFKHKDYDHNLAEGRSMLERELGRLGLEDLGYDRVAEHTPFARTEDLLAALGAGDYKLSRALLPFKRELERRTEPVIEERRSKPAARSNALRVNGVGNLLTTMARCCQPVPGDHIVGYITAGRGVTIHNQRCRNIQDLPKNSQNRLIEVEWGGDAAAAYPVEVLLSAYHRSGILHDITQVLKDSKIDLLKVNMETDSENIARVTLRLEVSGIKTLSRALGQLSKIQNVLDVKRVTN
ncbi:MAG: bifunctional (p)ppGpp synthetase/guanosine-3',5'-bis(diphosphate) 3'-pyrophosphohydrolase [Arenicellales bacterium]